MRACKSRLEALQLVSFACQLEPREGARLDCMLPFARNDSEGGEWRWKMRNDDGEYFWRELVHGRSEWLSLGEVSWARSLGRLGSKVAGIMDEERVECGVNPYRLSASTIDRYLFDQTLAVPSSKVKFIRYQIAERLAAICMPLILISLISSGLLRVTNGSCPRRGNYQSRHKVTAGAFSSLKILVRYLPCFTLFCRNTWK